jgi:hypothetical protein
MGKRKSKSQLVSNCCNAEIKVGGCADFEGDKSACTQYYVCTKCDNACDTHLNVRKVWKINPSTKVKGDKRGKVTEKLTKKEIEFYRKNEDF